MPSVIGPYDGRKARRKRCDACVKRQIKGGIPCENCSRTSRPCEVTAKHKGSDLVFVPQRHGRNINESNGSSEREQSPLSLHKSVFLKGTDRYLAYFFVSFLPMNVFASRSIPISDDLLAMSKSSPALRDAIDAVATLHYHRLGYVSLFGEAGNHSKVEALQAYARSVRCVQEKIGSGAFMGDQSALWVTFFLGLFELMRDPTGTNWLSHFLHGTSTMLRLQRPETLTCSGLHNTQRRSFFLATRIFEISRALVFSSTTFLSKPKWTAALARLWQGEGSALWHPKEALFDILPQFSELSIRALRFCVESSQLSTRARYALAKSLADEGLVLQASLQQWWVDTVSWEEATSDWITSFPVQGKSDIESLTGYAYYHAISIYLSGTYDYHPHWTSAEAPILTRSRIDWHVSEILRIGQELLVQGTAGVLLFFPLRVAGARASDEEQRKIILSLLHTTASRGFIVADSFITDLSDLWAHVDFSCPVEVDY